MKTCGLVTLADLPGLPGKDPTPTVKIAIGRLDDKLYDPRYGKFAITQRQVDGWRRNLSETFGGQVSFDFDHSSDRGAGTKAAAWVTGIDQTGTANGSLITADVQFTRAGAKAVRSGEYKYTSPTFVENYVDEHKQSHGPALIGGALTNRPVLRKGMPTLSLSKDSHEGVATLESKQARRERKRARRQLAELGSDSLAPRDSRAQMDLKELAKLLDLDESADLTTVVGKVVTLAGQGEDGAAQIAAAAAAKKASKKAKKLARKQTLALDSDGNVLLDAEGLAKLLADANAGASAATQLAEQTFNHAWQKALSEGRAAPSQEEAVRELHNRDPELAIRTLDSFVQIVPVKPTGSGEGPATEAPLGMELDRFQLHQEAKTLAAKKQEADPKLSDAEAYSLAAVEIEDRKFTLEHPGI